MHRFVELGADFNAVDLNGDNVLHIAASRGISWLVVYFHRVHHMDVNQTDHRGRTPLHIAALEHQEQIAWMLSNWVDDIDARDNEQMTALHLAALSNNQRIVRHLLMSGASRNAEDNQGMTPSDIALLVKAKDLVRILQNPSCWSSVNPIKPPIKPVTKSLRLFIIYHMIFVFRYALVFLFIMPGISEEYLYISIALVVINTLLYEIVSNLNPGYVEPQEGQDLLVRCMQFLYSKYNSESVCPSCETKRQTSTRHCQHCGRCVRHFDHHCPWINNCVGAGNHKAFTLFIAFLFLDFLYHCLLGAFDYADMLFKTNVIYHNYLTPEDRKKIGLAVSILCGLCLIPVAPLFVVQVGNLIMGKTTHERFGYKRNVQDSDATELHTDRLSQSDTQSMLLSQNENDFAFFSGTTMSVGGLSRDRIKISVRKRCCGLFISREVTLEDSQVLVLTNGQAAT